MSVRRFACVLLVDPRGRLLLQERDEHPLIDPECWSLPGGHVDEGEHPDDAAHRELAEETGLRAPGLRPWREFTVFHAAYGTDDTLHVYTAATTATDDDVVLGEGRQIVFVDPADLPDLTLGIAAREILPAFLASDRYQELLP